MGVVGGTTIFHDTGINRCVIVSWIGIVNILAVRRNATERNDVLSRSPGIDAGKKGVRVHIQIMDLE